jgi:hypothetical protein
MNHYKKLLIAVIISLAILSVSYVSAQTPTNSKLTTSSTINASTILPYHPRDPVSYYAEKQLLDNEIKTWEKAHPSSHKSSLIRPSPFSGVNQHPGFNGLDVNSAIFNNNPQDPPDVQVAVGPGKIYLRWLT